VSQVEAHLGAEGPGGLNRDVPPPKGEKRAVPVDPGCLPAWNVGDLPEPKVLSFRNLLALIGPGLVLAGGSVGTGEWVVGAQFASRYGGAMMFAILLSILAQVILNTEAIRYVLATGEPVMTGFLRTKPGPKFWLCFYLLLDLGSWWPSQAGLAAQILVVWIKGISPNQQIDVNTVKLVSYFVFIGCGVAALFGGKIYNTVQVVASGKFIFTLVFLVFACVFFVSAKHWMTIWGSVIDPTNLPKDPATGQTKFDWFMIAALSGFSGVGGLGNIMISNFYREKGWGMGKFVGAIPSAFGGHNIRLSHLGTIAADTPENARKFKAWYRYILPDQWMIWAGGSLIAMLLPAMLGLAYLNVNNVKSGGDDWRWAAAMAQDFGAAVKQTHGPGWGVFMMNLTLLCGLVIMIPGQFYTFDNTCRRWTDAVWSSSRWVRRMDTHSVKYIYYIIGAAYLTFGICAYAMTNLSAPTMLKIAGTFANLGIAACIFHTLYVNHRFLPKSMRPGVRKSVAMILAGCFFLVIFSLVVNQKVIQVYFR
jgi:hypothetical protein